VRATFWQAFVRYRGQVLAWGAILAVFSAWLSGLYDTMVEQMGRYIELVRFFPKEWMAFFGDFTTLATPEGYLNAEFFSWVPVVLGVFSAMAGAGLIIGDEEAGTLDLVIAHPVSRGRFFLGRLLAFLAATVAILFIPWAGFTLGMQRSSLGVRWDKMALPFVSMFSVLVLFGTAALMLSFVLPSRTLAGSTASALLLASYFVTSMARVHEGVKKIARYSPLNYYQGGIAITGLNLRWVAGLLAVTLVFILVAWWRFERRDIRVGGEGGWHIAIRARRQNNS
jgi:ABC-2 type transport system permease protein